MFTAVDHLNIAQRELERLFAACVVVTPINTIQESGWLQPEIISDGNIRRFWFEIKASIPASMNIEQAQQIAMQKALECGIYSDLLGSLDEVHNTYLANSYAVEIANRARNVAVGALMGELHQALMQNEHAKVQAIVARMNAAQAPTGEKYRTANEVHEHFLQAIDGARSVETFVPGWDEAMAGLERQTVTVLAARPGMGKSALSWQICRNVVTSDQEKKVIFFSLEMPEIGVWQRAVCPEVGVTWAAVRAGKITSAQREKLIAESHVFRDIYGERMIIDDTPNTTQSIWRAVSQIRPDLIVIDHLRKIKDRVKDQNENKRQGMIVASLTEIAKGFDLPVLLLCQLNRGVEGRMDKRPTLQDLRDSGEIEEEADNIVFMHSKDYYDKDNPTNVWDIDLWIDKFRNGASHQCIQLKFDLVRQWFDGRKTNQYN